MQHSLDIKLIIGSKFTLNQQLDVLLLCPTRQAYAELCRIITNARRRGDKGQYQLAEWDLMRVKHCLLIWLPQGKSHDEEWANWLRRHHPTRCWLGYQRHLTDSDRDYKQHCTTLAEQFSLPITACGGVLMHNATRQPLQHVLTAIREGQPVHQLGYNLISNTEQSLRSISKLKRLFDTQWLAQSVTICRSVSI